MKEILAFGDSLTWGADPATGLRHPAAFQWPRVTESGLLAHGLRVRLHADGIGGRTTCRDDHAGSACRNGAKALPQALSMHMPLDLVIVMLGTNDLKPLHGASPLAAQAGMRRLVQIIRHFPYKPVSATPKILLVAPPPCGPNAAGGRNPAQSRELAPLYRALAEEVQAGFFDAGHAAQGSAIDGVHLDAEASARLGEALVAPILQLLTR